MLPKKSFFLGHLKPVFYFPEKPFVRFHWMGLKPNSWHLRLTSRSHGISFPPKNIFISLPHTQCSHTHKHARMPTHTYADTHTHERSIFLLITHNSLTLSFWGALTNKQTNTFETFAHFLLVTSTEANYQQKRFIQIVAIQLKLKEKTL